MGTRTENDISSDIMSVFKMALLQEQSRRDEEHRIRQMKKEQEKQRRLEEKTQRQRERKEELARPEDERLRREQDGKRQDQFKQMLMVMMVGKHAGNSGEEMDKHDQRTQPR